MKTPESGEMAEIRRSDKKRTGVWRRKWKIRRRVFGFYSGRIIFNEIIKARLSLTGRSATVRARVDRCYPAAVPLLSLSTLSSNRSSLKNCVPGGGRPGYTGTF